MIWRASVLAMRSSCCACDRGTAAISASSRTSTLALQIRIEARVVVIIDLLGSIDRGSGLRFCDSRARGRFGVRRLVAAFQSADKSAHSKVHATQKSKG